jgi:type I restriction enzyme S subunit
VNDKGLAVSKIFPTGTIMVTIAANIADTCLLGIPMCAPDSLVGVIPNESDDTRFIELSIRNRKEWLYSRAPQSAQKNINLEDLRPLDIHWPDRHERSLIAEHYEKADRKIAALEDALFKLKQQKSGLMHDLLTGKVLVKVDESEQEST